MMRWTQVIWLSLAMLPPVGMASDATVPASAASTNAPATKSGKPDYFSTHSPRFEILLSDQALDALRVEPKEYVKATIREGGVLYTNVALKLKGARGSFRHVDDKPAFTLNFDKFADGQEFHGFDKLHLNNSVQDPTYMNEIICSELFRAAGVPTARATHARVKLNSRDLGLYVLKEGYDKGFLKRNFSNPDGNLYDGGFLMDVDQRLDRDEGPGQANWNDLDMLVGAAFESDLDARLRRLTAILDLDRFLSFAALEMLTCDWDGYLQNSNNYRLYHDPEQERFVFIPHGMDQMFWDLNFPITPGPAPMRGRRGGWRRGGLVAARAFEIPELQQRYLARVGQLLETEFTPARLETILHQVEARVTTTYGESEPKVATYLLGQTRHMRRHVGERMRIAAMQYREFAHLVRPGDR